VRRDTQNVLLVLLGGALVKIAATDLYLRYVKPGNRWYLLAAGTVILLLAVVSLVRDARLVRSAPATSATPAGHGTVAGLGAPATVGTLAGHHHEHREPHSPWLLILPVLAIFLVAPPALGADSVQRAAPGNSVSTSSDPGFPPLPTGGVPELRLSDFVARAVWDGSSGTGGSSGSGGSGGAGGSGGSGAGGAGGLAGRDVTLTGFVVHRAGAAELARLVITCCAADARPMVVRMTDAPDVPSGTWLRVRARLLPGSATVADGYTPSVRVADAVAIPEPAEAYEY